MARPMPCDCTGCTAARDRRRGVLLIMLVMSLIGTAAFVASFIH